MILTQFSTGLQFPRTDQRVPIGTTIVCYSILGNIYIPEVGSSIQEQVETSSAALNA